MQQTAAKHNPLTFYLRMLLYMFIALFLRVVTFLPLCALFVFPSGSPLKWLALLCPALLFFFLLPLRYSFADALVQRPRQRRFSFDTALSMGNYGEKLAESLLHAVNVIKWGIPLFAMLAYCYYCYGEVDMFTLLGSLSAIGKGLTDFWCGICNFFITLFGSIHTLTSAGGLMEGLYVIFAVLGLGVLIWLYGALRNSASRYIWVTATREERSPRTDARRRLRGRRWRQVVVGLCNLVLWTPFLIVVLSVMKDVLSDVSSQLMMIIAQQKMPSLDMAKAVMPLVFAFVFLYMPLLPVRRYLTAAFAARKPRRVAPRKAEARTAQQVTGTTPAAAPVVSESNDPGQAAASAGFDAEAAVQEAPVPPFTAEGEAFAVSSGMENGPDYLEKDGKGERLEWEGGAEYVAPSGDGESKEPSTFTIGQ